MNSLTVQISATLKQLRQQRGWRLGLTSQKTGVSKAMLGQIERGESSPTIATLWKIASGMEVSFSSFLESVSPHPKDCIYRKQNLEPLHPKDQGIRILPLFLFDAHLGFEVFVVELLPKCLHLSPAHQSGVIEHVMGVEGTPEVLVGTTWHTVNPQEGLRFAADQPHGYRNRSPSPARFHNLIHYPPTGFSKPLPSAE